MKKIFTYFFEKKTWLLACLLTILSVAGYAQTHFYVSPAGNDAGNGFSPSTAKLTIQNAINTATAGDIINIDPGMYNARVTITKSLTLQGSDEATCILSGTGLLGTGKGILIDNGVTNVTIKKLTVQNFAGSNGNSDAGIYAPGGNNNLKIEHVTIRNNVGGSGFYANGPINNVTLDYVTSSGHTVGARGIVIWNGLKSNITITNCQVFGNNCCGIELQDGSASGVTMSNNNVYNNGDNGMSAVGLTGSVGPNIIANNVLTDNGRFGIEVKNPNGSATVSGNTVSRTVPFASEVRDGAGISVFRRGVLGTNVDVPTGVQVLNNIVSGYVQPSTSEGFGIVVEGTNHTVTGNTVTGCEVGIQQQAGYLPYPGDGDQINKVDAYFGRGNAPIACGNFISGNTFSSNGINTRNTGTIGGTGFITNTTTGETFCSIQAAINDAQTLAGHTLELTAGIFNEQVLVNKSVIIKGVGASQPVINFTGTPTGKQTVFDISVANVTIENLNIKVDLTKLSSAIIASGTNVSNLTVKNNKIEAYASSIAASFGSYGNRNAVSVNYGSYRVAPAGVSNIVFMGNTISGVVDDGFGKSRFFRSGISADESGGTFSGNTIQSINQDILVRFGNNGNINITNNIFNGGGVELADMNAGAGILTVSGNSFHGAFASVAAPNAAVLRLKNNYHAKTTLVNTNTFSHHQWAVSMENYNSVTLTNNSFTPLAGSAVYRHITINTKSISTNSSTIVQVALGAVITKNSFNGSGVAGGSALSFYNHDNDNASFGSFVIGGAGNENDFNAGIGNFISLDNQAGVSNTAVFPAYNLVIGTGAGSLTTMANWATSINAENNRFDLGSGLQLPSAMPLTDLFSLEDKVQHKIDLAALGFITIKANNDFVTVNSFLPPSTNAASIQRGVDAASNGFMVNVGQGTFTDNVVVNKEVEIRGQGQSLTKIIPAISNPNCGGSGGGSICAGSSNVFLVQANNVTINQLAIDGDNPSLTSGNVIDGADIDARNGIITNHVAGIYSNLNVNHVTMQNIFLRGIYASSGGSFNFSDNTVSNVKGNSGSIALFNFGGAGSFTNNTVSNANDGIASNWSLGTVYTGNTVTNSGSGIHTDNNGGGGGVADLIQNNQVSNSTVYGYGIWVFAPFLTVQVKDNIVSNVDVGLACAGQQNPVTPVFSGNTVDGQNKLNSTGVYITTSLFGWGSTNVTASFKNNFIRNNTDGFYLESEAGNNLMLEAHNNSLTGNTNNNVAQGVGASGAGSFSANMECNWWGTASASGITATISGAAVDHSPWLSNGTDNDLVSPGFQPGGICSIAVSNAQVTATTDIHCFGESTGSATISFDNGFAAFSYSLDGGAPMTIAQSPFTLNGLAAGAHTVIITDGGGNTASVNFILTQPTALPITSITTTNADTFCNKLTLTAASAGPGTTYNWLSGSSSFANTQQINLGQANGDGYYSVSITVNGCTSTPASYHFEKQKLVSSYTILAFDEVKLGENNKVNSGSVGVTSPSGEAEFKRNSSVASPGSFVKARYIDKNGSNINILHPVYSAATGIILPTMLYNTANTNHLPSTSVNRNVTATLSGNYKNLTLKKGSNTTLTGTTFGTINVEQGARVKFMATTININKLSVDKGPKNGYSHIRFAGNANVLVSNSVSIGSQVYVNQDNYKVTFYMGNNSHNDEKFSVKGGDTRIIANIYMPDGKLKVTGGYAYGNGDEDADDSHYGQGNSYVYMTGVFIAEEVESHGKNVIWNSFDCSVGPVPVNTGASSVTQALSEEKTNSEEELKVTVLPNPSTTYFTLKLESKYETPVNMRVIDAGGRVVDARSKIGANSTIQVGQDYSSGIYYAEMIQGTRRKVVQLIKARK